MKQFPLLLCLFLLFLLVVAGIPAAASTSISYFTPSSGPNDGDVAVTITGSGFNANTTVWMTPANYCDPNYKIWGSIRSRSDNTMTVRFSLSGKTPGPYRMWVNSPLTNAYGTTDDEATHATVFEIYKGTGRTYTTAATTVTTTTVRTTATSGDGENSVFFETNPPGATIFLNGNEVGTSTFTYYTNKKGVFDVVVKKAGYQDYQAKVTILEGVRVHFYAPLDQLVSGSLTSGTTPASGTSAKPVTTIQKSTLKVPTPLGTFAPPPEESPVDPALALGAAALVLALVVFRRR
jgi:hypothetical protein